MINGIINTTLEFRFIDSLNFYIKIKILNNLKVKIPLILVDL